MKFPRRALVEDGAFDRVAADRVGAVEHQDGLAFSRAASMTRARVVM